MDVGDKPLRGVVSVKVSGAHPQPLVGAFGKCGRWVRRTQCCLSALGFDTHILSRTRDSHELTSLAKLAFRLSE